MNIEKNKFNEKAVFIIAVTLSLTAFILFLIDTSFVINPILLFISSIFFLMPYRKDSFFIRRLILFISIMFVFWLAYFARNALIPFVLAFIIAYLLDPLVTKLTKNRIPRWIASIFIMMLFLGVVSIIAVFGFPALFAQMNDISKKIANVVNTVTTYLETRKIYQVFDALGIKDENLRTIIRKEFTPEIKIFLETIFTSLLNLLKGISGIASQILNAIITPIFAFYFLKDFPKFKSQIKSIIGKKNDKLLLDIRRINEIFKVYIGWQFIAASIVAVSCIVVFSLTNVSFPIVLGILCGFLNPIPYLGMLASMILCSLIIVVIDSPNMFSDIVVIVSTISALHFIIAYFIEPNILGRRVGLHPLILFLSLFLFGGLFGFVGLLIAVPCTATLMLFYNDWRESVGKEDEISHEASDFKINTANADG